METRGKGGETPSRTFLSHGIEALFSRNGMPKADSDERKENDSTDIYDVVIIGSGYGGAIAAEKLAGRQVKLTDGQARKIKVCVIERGKEFLPGAFPSKLEETPTEVRASDPSKPITRGNQEGLFDFRPGTDVNVVLANGVGGGSLINAGVMMRAKDSVFESWGKDFTSQRSLHHYYDKAYQKLVSTVGETTHDNVKNRISSAVMSENAALHKTDNLKRLDPSAYTEPDLSISMRDAKNYAGVKLKACKLCGDCSTGCNFQSKNSLDTNLLHKAWSHGIEIFTGGSVLTIEKNSDDEWIVNVVYTHQDLRKQNPQSLAVRCKNIILAAGSLGSTEILLRSQSDDLRFSNLLGSKFSTNGDMIITAYNQTRVSNSVADENVPHAKRRIGPTISGMIDKRKSESTNGFVIQDMAIPAICNIFFTEFLSTLVSFKRLTQLTTRWHSLGSNAMNDPSAIDTAAIQNTSVYAAMGDDGAKGKLYLPGGSSNQQEGSIKIGWKAIRNSPLFDDQIRFLESAFKRRTLFSRARKVDVFANPIWKLLPDSMQRIFLKNMRGPVATVHPLGGCPMADSAEDGVTNHLGKVFDVHPENDADPRSDANSENKSFHEGLLVLDGSIIPTALGINPALTIAAVTERALDLLLDDANERWGVFIKARQNTSTTVKKYSERPIFREIRKTPVPATPTKVTITERLNGMARILDDTGAMRDVVLELTILTKEIPLKSLRGQTDSQDKELKIDNKTDEYNGSKFKASKLRIYYLKDWEKIRKSSKYAEMSDDYLNDVAQYIAPIEGSVQILRQEKTFLVKRTVIAGWAWWNNRGKRDIYQALKSAGKNEPLGLMRVLSDLSAKLAKASTFLINLIAMVSKGGELRKFVYSLKVKLPEAAKINRDFTYFNGQDIIGVKEFTYSRRSNPWRQLSEIKLTKLPQRDNDKEPVPVLVLDTQYLASKRIPLLQITNQENQVQAIKDLFSFSMYMARLVFRVHFLSFRNPEPPLEHRIDHRPAPLKGMAFPVEHRLRVGSIPDDRIEKLQKGDDVFAHATEYRHPSPRKPPVLMIHGYSASGSTFSHSSLPNSLAKYFYEDERTVWIADLRTSPVHRHSIYPWTFEQVANSDIPKIVDYIYERSDEQKIDTIAHCMGSAMLSMALLNSRKLKDQPNFYKDRLNRIVFSQAAPALTLTPENTFRSFLSFHLKELIPSSYQFKPTNESNLITQLLDRLLYTLPYPTRDYDPLNPWRDRKKRVHHAQTRHRMDAFYGRTFELGNMSEESLGRINDFFGPMHIETMNQVSQFARKRVLTTHLGQNVYLNKHLLKKNWPFPTFSIHSINNGLVDFSTGRRTRAIFSEAGIQYETVLIEDKKYGHQDSILGPNAHQDIFPHMARFLGTNFNIEKPSDSSYVAISNRLSAVNVLHKTLPIEPPQMGPILFKPDSSHDDFIIALGTNDSLASTPVVIAIPVTINNDKQIYIAGDSIEQRKEVIANSVESSLDWANRSQSSYVASHLDDKKIDDWVTLNLKPAEFEHYSMQGELLILLIYPGALSIGKRAVPQNSNHNTSNSTKRSSSEHYLHRRKTMDSLRKDDGLGMGQNIQVNEHIREQFENELIEKLLEEFFSSDQAQDSQYLRGLIRYKSAKTPVQKDLSFAFGSCQYPSNPLDRQVAYRAYENLDLRIFNKDGTKEIEFLALIGDQVYVDATAGFLDPIYAYEKFEQPYINWLSNPYVSSVFRQVPLFNMLDDHEIINNWEPKAHNVDSWNADKDFKKGVSAFLKYQRGATVTDTKVKPVLWYHFVEKGFDFFMADTRTERCFRDAGNVNNDATLIMHDSQFQALSKWLKNSHEKAPHKPKFIFSSCALLPSEILDHTAPTGASAIRADGWDGYPQSLHKLLSLIVDQGIDNVVFLCGDIHLNVDAELVIANKTKQASVSARIITCSGLYAPLPFANRDLDSVHDQQTYTFQYGQSDQPEAHCSYECEVTVNEKNECNGFAIIKAEAKSSKVKLEFMA